MGLGKGALLWLLGVPIPIIILLMLFWRWRSFNDDAEVTKVLPAKQSIAT